MDEEEGIELIWIERAKLQAPMFAQMEEEFFKELDKLWQTK
jgi:hypothetical protein